MLLRFVRLAVLWFVGYGLWMTNRELIRLMRISFVWLMAGAVVSGIAIVLFLRAVIWCGIHLDSWVNH
jgi:hypothetical protein